MQKLMWLVAMLLVCMLPVSFIAGMHVVASTGKFYMLPVVPICNLLLLCIVMRSIENNM